MVKQTITSLTRKGWSQKKIARTLGIRKMKVVTYQKTHKIGKRVKSEFWSSVKTSQRDREISFKEARELTFNQPYWARKRAVRQGKEYKSFKDFWQEWGEKWREADETERNKIYDHIYGDEGGFEGGTPR